MLLACIVSSVGAVKSNQNDRHYGLVVCLWCRKTHTQPAPSESVCLLLSAAAAGGKTSHSVPTDADGCYLHRLILCAVM